MPNIKTEHYDEAINAFRLDVASQMGLPDTAVPPFEDLTEKQRGQAYQSFNAFFNSLALNGYSIEPPTED